MKAVIYAMPEIKNAAGFYGLGGISNFNRSPWPGRLIHHSGLSRTLRNITGSLCPANPK